MLRLMTIVIGGMVVGMVLDIGFGINEPSLFFGLGVFTVIFSIPRDTF